MFTLKNSTLFKGHNRDIFPIPFWFYRIIINKIVYDAVVAKNILTDRNEITFCQVWNEMCDYFIIALSFDLNIFMLLYVILLVCKWHGMIEPEPVHQF